MSRDLLRVVLLDPEVLPLKGIWQYQEYLSNQGLNNKPYWLAFWKKLFQPLATAALVFVAISFIFGPLRSVTMGQRLFTGVLVGFGFQIGQDLLGIWLLAAYCGAVTDSAAICNRRLFVAPGGLDVS